MAISITYERGGVPVELTDEPGFRRAIEQRHLRRETMVKLFVDDDDLKGRVMRAGDVDALRAIFDESDPPPPPPAPPPVLPVVEEEPVIAAEAPRPVVAPVREARRAPAPAAGKNSAMAILVVLALIALAVLIEVVGSSNGRSPVKVSAPTFDVDPGAEANVTDVADAPVAEAPARTFETSFDCRAPGNGFVERTICGDRALAQMDLEMSRLYADVRQEAPDAGAREALLAGQREWIAARTRCANLEDPRLCIADAYRARMTALRQARQDQSAAASEPESANMIAAEAPAAPDRSRAARLRSGRIGTDDYPRRALAERAEGNVSAILTVADDGSVSGCNVVRSSGSALLDGATCKLFSDRLRYEPALDRDGNPIAATVQQSINWVLPD